MLRATSNNLYVTAKNMEMCVFYSTSTVRMPCEEHRRGDIWGIMQHMKARMAGSDAAHQTCFEHTQILYTSLPWIMRYVLCTVYIFILEPMRVPRTQLYLVNYESHQGRDGIRTWRTINFLRAHSNMIFVLATNIEICALQCACTHSLNAAPWNARGRSADCQRPRTPSCSKYSTC